MRPEASSTSTSPTSATRTSTDTARRTIHTSTWHSAYSSSTRSAYCVVDNNFTAAQFFQGTYAPLENLQVTAAHEFFHAVQFAYDAVDDQWFMESTATWMEDEIYDDVNDNLRVPAPTARCGKPLVPARQGRDERRSVLPRVRATGSLPPT